MKPPSNRSPLLADVLAEAESPDDFRASLLGTTLTLVRRRRRRRQIGGVTIAGAAAVLFAALLWPRVDAHQTAVVKTRRGNTPIVATLPLPRAAIVVTVALTPEQAIATYASVTTIETLPGVTPLRLIDDRELLALAAPYPVALVRVGPQSEELLFLNPKDQAELVR
jgi:hypothetical protein